MIGDNITKKYRQNPPVYSRLTLHRAENTDDPNRLTSVVEALNSLENYQAIFPVHPRTRKASKYLDIEFRPHIQLIDPVGYLEMLFLEENSSFIVTDSGGVQKEAYYFKKPCITLRDQTEWEETVKSGWNILVGSDKDKIVESMRCLKKPKISPAFFGDGRASEKILEHLLYKCN